MNRGAPSKLAGHRVLVYANGIVWRDPQTGHRYALGSDRIAARDQLRELLDRRRLEPRKAPESRAPEPAASDGASALLRRAHWRAYYYASARANRLKRPILSRDEFAALMERAGGRCELTRIPFSHVRAAPGLKALWAPSLDRLDCKLGYEATNCRLVCVAVNIALNEFGVDVLLKIASALRTQR